MTRGLIIRRAGPALSVQDHGRQGLLNVGLSRGGAADQLALAEAAALLGTAEEITTLEMAGFGGIFEALGDIQIALTGATMPVTMNGDPLAWNASHWVPSGAEISIGAPSNGNFGYLSLYGTNLAKPVLGGQAAHIVAGIGRHLVAGDTITVAQHGSGQTGYRLDAEDRFGGGSVRIVESFHSALFPQAVRARFQNTAFTRDPRGNRMGVKLGFDGDGFQPEGGRTLVSEVVLPGDIQVTGDGTPFVLLSECQTTGGYPRIGTVIPRDLPRVAQSLPGATLRFEFIPLDAAVALERDASAGRKRLIQTRKPMVRDPGSIRDLLSYQLISGAVTGQEE